MYANSRSIQSAQETPHERLAEIVQRHRDHAFQRPIAAHARQAFERLKAHWHPSQPLVLDAGCGVGASSLQLARAMPEAFVVGVDQSGHRLGRGKEGPLPGNLLLLRTDLVDFWRLMAHEGVRLHRHYLLYPNPWPKIGQVQRRWHAHPVFPFLLQLGGVLECRSNWKVYVEELAVAIAVLRGIHPAVERFEASAPLTPFERKYRDSGQELYRLQVDLDV